MNKIDTLLNRVVEVKMLKHQQLVDRMNGRHNEQMPSPIFWVAVAAISLLIMSNWLG